MKTSRVLIVFGLVGMMLFSGHVMANDRAKTELAKKSIREMEVAAYASPSFKALLHKAYKVNAKVERQKDYGCDFADGYYLGYGNGDVKVTQLKATVLKNGVTRATWVGVSDGSSEKNTVDFDMTCQGNRCVIEDVRHIYAGETSSMKKEANYMVKHQKCMLAD